MTRRTAFAVGGQARRRRSRSPRSSLPDDRLRLAPIFEQPGGDLGGVGPIDDFTPDTYRAGGDHDRRGIGEAGKTTVYVRSGSPGAAARTRTSSSPISTRCAHLGCPVRFVEAAGNFICPCHGGVYDFEGKVIGGPPVRPLDRFQTRVVGDQVEIGPRYSVTSQLEPVRARDPGEFTGGIWEYLYPPRPSTAPAAELARPDARCPTALASRPASRASARQRRRRGPSGAADAAPGRGRGRQGGRRSTSSAGSTSAPAPRGFLTGMLFRKVPKGTNWFYTLGSATLFAFVVQAMTGVFLAMYYTPSPTEAYASITHLTNDVFLGEFVRGMHKWGATVMIILIFLHMGRTFFFGAYKYPRELNWVIGVVLLILTLVMGLTGYLLPFDQRSYWATIVGDQHHRHRPRASAPTWPTSCAPGPSSARPRSRASTRSTCCSCRALIIALIGAHLYLVVKLGHHRAALGASADPKPKSLRRGGRQRLPDAARRCREAAEKEAYLREYEVLKKKGKPFFPYAVIKDSVMALVVVVVIVVDVARARAPSWARRPTRPRPPTCRGPSGTSSSSSSCCA